jgi:hypothetical protein
MPGDDVLVVTSAVCGIWPRPPSSCPAVVTKRPAAPLH